MPYREKIAWLSLAAIAITFGPYFAYVAWSSPPDETPNFQLLALYGAASIAQLVILGVGYLFVRARTPVDDRPADERDRAVAGKSAEAGYMFLLLGMILVGGIMPFYSGGWSVVNAAFLSITLGQVLRYAMVIRGYRRAS